MSRYIPYIPFILNILQTVASDVIIRNDSSIYYVSSGDQDIQNFLRNLPGFQTASTGIEIAFKELNERAAPLLPPENNNKFIKLVKDMRQNDYVMSQESIDSIKSWFQMDSHCTLPVSDSKNIELFWSTVNHQSRRQVVQKKFKQFKHLVEKSLKVHIQGYLVMASLLFAAWSINDLCNNSSKSFEKNIIEKLESGKIKLVNVFNLMELSLKTIIENLENLSNIREIIQSNVVYKTQLQILNSSTQIFINELKEFDDRIQKDIKDLSIAEFHRRKTSVVSTLVSATSFGVTLWNWKNLNTQQRAAGVIVGGMTGGTAVLTHLSVNQLQKLQNTLKQTLTDLNSLNVQLLRIKSAESHREEYDCLRDQFEDYLRSINNFKRKFQ